MSVGTLLMKGEVNCCVGNGTPPCSEDHLVSLTRLKTPTVLCNTSSITKGHNFLSRVDYYSRERLAFLNSVVKNII